MPTTKTVDIKERKNCDSSYSNYWESKGKRTDLNKMKNKRTMLWCSPRMKGGDKVKIEYMKQDENYLVSYKRENKHNNCYVQGGTFDCFLKAREGAARWVKMLKDRYKKLNEDLGIKEE
jgi:hypothetical protein